MRAWLVSGGVSDDGIAELSVPVHADSGRVKGFAVLRCADAATAEAARALDHADMNGRWITIRDYSEEKPVRAPRAYAPREERAPRAERSSGSGRGGASGSSRPRERGASARAAFVPSSDSRTLFVGNLPWSATEESLAEYLCSVAGADHCTVRLAVDHTTGRSRGFAHAEFDAHEQAAAVVQAANDGQGMEMEQRRIRVDFAPPRAARR